MGYIYIIDTEFDCDRNGDIRKNLSYAQLLQLGCLKVNTDTFEVEDTLAFNVIPEHDVSQSVQEFLGIGKDGYTEDAVHYTHCINKLYDFIGSTEYFVKVYSYGDQDTVMLNLLAEKMRLLFRFHNVDVSQNKCRFKYKLNSYEANVDDRSRMSQADMFKYLFGTAPEETHTALSDCYALKAIIQELSRLTGDIVIDLTKETPEHALFCLTKDVERNLFEVLNFNKSPLFKYEFNDGDDNTFVISELRLGFVCKTIAFSDRRGRKMSKIGLSVYTMTAEKKIGNLIRECNIEGDKFVRTPLSEEQLALCTEWHKDISSNTEG